MAVVFVACLCDSRVRIIDYFDREVKRIRPDSEFFFKFPPKSSRDGRLEPVTAFAAPILDFQIGVALSRFDRRIFSTLRAQAESRYVVPLDAT